MDTTAALQFNAADPTAWRDRLVHGAAPEAERLAAATREFEAVLLRQYLSEALKPMTKGGAVLGGNNAVYGYLVNDALANGLTSGGDVFSFSHLLQAQLAGAAASNHDDTTDPL
jgi:hypothetical protein